MNERFVLSPSISLDKGDLELQYFLLLFDSDTRVYRNHIFFSRQQWIDIHLLDFRCKTQQSRKAYNNFGEFIFIHPLLPRVPLIIL